MIVSLDTPIIAPLTQHSVAPVTVTAAPTANAAADHKPPAAPASPLVSGVAIGVVIASGKANVDLGSLVANLMAAQQAYDTAARISSAPVPALHVPGQAI
jgi:hypothetical protein